MEQIFVNGGIFAAVTLLQSAVLFLLMQTKRDNSIIDIAYGPMFFISALSTLLITKNSSPTALVITFIIGVWATRLSYRIGKKNWGKPEDVLYAAWRTEWMKRGSLYFILRSFLQINLLQGILIVLIASPFIIAVSHSATHTLFLVLGAAISLGGLLLEATADKRIDTFLKEKKAGLTLEPFLRTGLFRYSRRPNYFGETLVWWGLAVTTIAVPFGYLALIGPLTITYIVTKITGPMLEKIFIEKFGEAYKAYMQETSYFIPLPPKKNTN